MVISSHLAPSPDGRVAIGGPDDGHHGLAGVACGHVPQHPGHVGAACPAVTVHQVHATPADTLAEMRKM